MCALRVERDFWRNSMSDVIDVILYAGDLHKKAKDPGNIINYVDCNVAVQRSLMKLIKDKGVTKFVSLGDWYDRGYINDMSAGFSDTDLDTQMSNMLHGEFYGIIGNHIRLKMDSNPELFLIQPHPTLVTRHPVYRKNQIIRTPEYIRVGDVQISLMHFNYNRKTLGGYKPVRQEWAKSHIAIFHTPWIIPNQQLSKAGLEANTYTVSVIGECLKDVDLAICGDIHKPLGKFVVEHEFGSTMMVVPGSLTNSSVDRNSRHYNIHLPLTKVYDDGTFSLEFVDFDLLTNIVTFKSDSESKKDSKLDGIRARRKETKVEQGSLGTTFDRTAPDAFSMRNLIVRKGYNDKDVRMIDVIFNNPLDVTALIKIYTEEISIL